MLNESLIQQLKQTVNISTDAEKTKQRFKAVWKAASAAEKKAIEKSSGVSHSTLYRVCNTGSISARIIAAASQMLNVSPYYLTGEADEPGESSEPILREFLEKLGYQDLLAQSESEPKPQRARKKRAVKTEKPPKAKISKDKHPADEIVVIEENIVITPDASSFFDEFAEEDIILLLRSVKIRAKARMAGAAKQAGELKRILLS